MKTLSLDLQAHLDAGTTTLAWCWRISRADGVTLGFTDHDRALAFEDITFEPESGFAASEIRAGSDLAVDAQDATGVLIGVDSFTIQGEPVRDRERLVWLLDLRPS